MLTWIRGKLWPRLWIDGVTGKWVVYIIDKPRYGFSFYDMYFSRLLLVFFFSWGRNVFSTLGVRGMNDGRKEPEDYLAKGGGGEGGRGEGKS